MGGCCSARFVRGRASVSSVVRGPNHLPDSQGSCVASSVARPGVDGGPSHLSGRDFRGGLSALAAIKTAAPMQPPSAPTMARNMAASPAFSSGTEAPINMPTIAGTSVPASPARKFQIQNSTACAPRFRRQRAMITEGAAESAPISETIVRPIKISGISDALIMPCSTSWSREGEGGVFHALDRPRRDARVNIVREKNLLIPSVPPARGWHAIRAGRFLVAPMVSQRIACQPRAIDPGDARSNNRAASTQQKILSNLRLPA